MEQLVGFLSSQDKYKGTKQYKDKAINDPQTCQLINQAIIQTLNKGQPMSKLLALRLAKETAELNIPAFHKLLQDQILQIVKEYAQFRSDDQYEGRGKFLFSNEPSKEVAQIGNSVFRLCTDLIRTWAAWYPNSKFSNAYQSLLNQGVTFPALQYYKQEQLVEVIDQSKKPKELIQNIYKLQEYLGDLLSGDGNDEEIGMLDEAVGELQEYSKEVQKMLMDIIDSDQQDIISDLLQKQDFFEKFTRDFQALKQTKITIQQLKSRYSDICSTPNPDATPMGPQDQPQQQQQKQSKIQQQVQKLQIIHEDSEEQSKIMSKSEHIRPSQFQSTILNEKVQQQQLKEQYEPPKDDRQETIPIQSQFQPSSQFVPQSVYQIQPQQQQSTIQANQQIKDQQLNLLESNQTLNQGSLTFGQSQKESKIQSQQNKFNFQEVDQDKAAIKTQEQSHNQQLNLLESNQAIGQMQLNFGASQKESQIGNQKNKLNFQEDDQSKSAIKPQQSKIQENLDRAGPLNQFQSKVLQSTINESNFLKQDQLEKKEQQKQNILQSNKIEQQSQQVRADKQQNIQGSTMNSGIDGINMQSSIMQQQDLRKIVSPQVQNQFKSQQTLPQGDQDYEYKSDNSTKKDKQQQQELFRKVDSNDRSKVVSPNDLNQTIQQTKDMIKQSQTLARQPTVWDKQKDSAIIDGSQENEVQKISDVQSNIMVRKKTNQLQIFDVDEEGQKYDPNQSIKNNNLNHQQLNLSTISQRRTLSVNRSVKENNRDQEQFIQNLSFNQESNNKRQQSIEMQVLLEENKELKRQNQQIQLLMEHKYKTLNEKLEQVYQEKLVLNEQLLLTKFQSGDTSKIQEIIREKQVLEVELASYKYMNQQTEHKYQEIKKEYEKLQYICLQKDKEISKLQQNLKSTTMTNFTRSKRSESTNTTNTSFRNSIRVLTPVKNLNEVQRNLIYPFQDPLEYYDDKCKKEPKGRLCYNVLDWNQIQRESKAQCVMTVFQKQSVMELKQIKVGLQLKYRNEDSGTISIYFFNLNQLNKLQVEVTLNITEQIRILNQVQNNIQLEIIQDGSEVLVLEYKILQHPFCLQLLSFRLTNIKSNKVMDLILPITIYQQLSFQQINLRDFKQQWKYNISKVIRTSSFQYNPQIIQDLEQIKQYFNHLIVVNPHRMEEYLIGIDEIKYGGLFTFKGNRYLIRFIITPKQQMIIQLEHLVGKEQQSEFILNTLQFLLN